MTDETTLRVAVLDDYQQFAGSLGDWSQISPAVALDPIAEHIDGLDGLIVEDIVAWQRGEALRIVGP